MLSILEVPLYTCLLWQNHLFQSNTGCVKESVEGYRHNNWMAASRKAGAIATKVLDGWRLSERLRDKVLRGGGTSQLDFVCNICALLYLSSMSRISRYSRRRRVGDGTLCVCQKAASSQSGSDVLRAPVPRVHIDSIFATSHPRAKRSKRCGRNHRSTPFAK